MTSKRGGSAIICFVLVLTMLWPTQCSAGNGLIEPKFGAAGPSAVLLYGSFEDPQSGRRELMALYSLLRAYCYKVSLVRLDDYRTGLLNGANYVFVTGARDEPLREDFGRDLKSLGGVVGWIGGGMERYAGYGLTAGFAVEGYTDQFAEIRYPFQNGKSGMETVLTGHAKFAPKLAVTDGQLVQTIGTVSDGMKTYPYVVRSGNVWYVPLLGSDGPNGIVFRDLLSRLFGKPPAQSPHVYVKLDHISPFIDLAELENKAEWLHAQGVPYMAELRPVFLNTDYKEMENYFQAIRRIVQLGGTPILGNLPGWSPADEWQSYVEGYVPANGPDSLIPEKLFEASLRAYVNNNIYPVALSGPPDLLFDPEFSGALERFSTFVQSGPWKAYFRDIGPDEAWKGVFIPDLLPEEIGGAKRQTQQTRQADFDLAKAGNKTVISFDAMAKPEDFRTAVLHLKQAGATFDDLMKTDSLVAFGDTSIAVKDGVLAVNGKRPAGKAIPSAGGAPDNSPQPLTGINKRIKQTMVFVLAITGAFVALFVIAFLAGKRIDRRKHMR